MGTAIRAATTAFLAALAWAAVGVAPGLTDPPADEPITDRKGFIPYRKHEPIKGTAVGLLVGDSAPVLAADGRYGPADALCFSADGNSYRWIYVPVNDRPRIINLRVPIGDKQNTQFVVFPALDMALPKNVAPWGITAKYTLVEVEVNNGVGSPRNDSFVASKMKVLDGTKAYPLRPAEVIKGLKERYAAYLKDQAKATETALTAAQKKAIQDGKATGPREQSEVMYVTWLTQAERLRVHFRTKIADGQFTYVEVGPRFRPNPLPPPPRVGQGGKIQPPPPPRFHRFKTGVSFGIEFGMAYEVDKQGKLVQTRSLPIESFVDRLPPPPARFLPPGRPVPLPAPVPPAKNP